VLIVAFAGLVWLTGRGVSMSQPIWSMMFNPIQSSGPQGSQRLQVISEQRQADRKHP